MTKRILQMLTIITFSFILISCTDTTTEETTTESIETTTLETLSAPENVSNNTNVISWDEVENATNYMVHIGSDMFITTETEYTISVEGSYNVYIVAYADGYNNSEPSTTIAVTLEFTHQVEFDVTVEDDLVSWLAIDDAVSYNVNINGTNYNTTELSYSLDSFEPGLLFITVQALFPIGDSNFCNHIVYENDLVDGGTLKINYSKYSTIDVLIFDLGADLNTYILDSESEYINSEDVFNVNEDTLTLKSSYLSGLTVGTNYIYIVKEGIKTEIEINLTEKTVPYIITGTDIHTDGSVDIKFQLELFGGELYSVNGTIDDTVLYDFNNNVLTIQKEFIAEKFLTEETFVLSYVVNKNDTSVVGYMFFSLED